MQAGGPEPSAFVCSPLVVPVILLPARFSPLVFWLILWSIRALPPSQAGVWQRRKLMKRIIVASMAFLTLLLTSTVAPADARGWGGYRGGWGGYHGGGWGRSVGWGLGG